MGNAHHEAQMGAGHSLSVPAQVNQTSPLSPHPPPHHRHNKTIVLISVMVCAGTGLILGVLSDGVHHDDDLTHFLFARWSWWYPGYLVHVWGRPGFTVPMALVSGWFDRETAWHIARAASACVTLASSLVAAALARRLSLRYWPWVVALCYLQPLNMVLSYTTLTENFTALYLIAALYLLHRRRAVSASAVFSLVLVTRLETVVLLPVWALCVWSTIRDLPNERRVILIVGLNSLWAPIAQNVAHWAFFGTWPISAFLHPSGSSEYLTTGPLAFLPPLLLATTPVVMLFAIVGGPQLIRRGGASVIAIATVFLLTHWLIKWFGIFASGGFARFVVSVAPLLAIAAAAGLESSIDAFRSTPRRVRRITLLAMAVMAIGYIAANIELRVGRLPIDLIQIDSFATSWPTLAIIVVLVIAALIRNCTIGRAVACLVWAIAIAFSIFQWIIVVRPLRLMPEHRLAKDVVRSLRADPKAPVFAANPWIAWWSGHIENPRAHKGPRLLSTMPVGTRFIWDAIYSPSDFHRLLLSEYLSDPAYRIVGEWRIDKNEYAEFVMLEKMAPTAIATDDAPYPRPLTLGRGECTGSYYLNESDSRPIDHR